MGRAALECRKGAPQFGCTGKFALCGFATKQLKVITMKLSIRSKLVFAAAIGLAFSAGAAHAQLLINLKETATFSPFTGGTNNGVTNNGSSSSGGVNTSDVITTGTPVAAPFSITYNPLTSALPTNITLNTGTLNVATLLFNSTLSPLNTFSSLLETVTYDFDNNGTVDLTQQYTIGLTPFTSPNGLTAVNYSIVPVQFFGNVTINGSVYGYASVVSNSVGTLFDGSSTSAAIQFQFLSNPIIPVPEPSTYALAGVLALGGIVVLRRRFNGRGNTYAAALAA